MEHKDISIIAAEVRQQLKAEFPLCKFSVTIQRFSGGQSMNVALMQAPFKALVGANHAQLNQYEFRGVEAKERGRGLWESGVGVHRDPACETIVNNGAQLTEQAWDTMVRADQIADSQNWDKSEIQSD